MADVTHMDTYTYARIFIGGLNIGDFIQKLPKFTPRQYFILYDIYVP